MGIKTFNLEDIFFMNLAILLRLEENSKSYLRALLPPPLFVLFQIYCSEMVQLKTFTAIDYLLPKINDNN